MAIDRARNQIRSYVPPDMLEQFEDLCETTDDLWDRLDAEQDPSKAWGLAVDWATSILALARSESALLSGILPHLRASLESGEGRIAEIRVEQENARKTVYELRGPDGMSVQPLQVGRSERRAKESEEAKAERNAELIRLGEELRKIAAERAPVRLAIGQVGLSLRALRLFQDTRFPVPLKKRPFKLMSGVANPDLTQDPLKAFADRWVAGMNGRGSPEAQAMRAAKAKDAAIRRRPHRDWDEEKRKHREMMRQRSLERQD